MKESQKESDWSELPQDILIAITKPLKSYSDYIRLRSVCHNYHSFLPPIPPHSLPPQLPWLLLPPQPPSTTIRRNFFNLLSSKTHSLHHHHLQDTAYPRRISGSSHGYLILVTDSPDIFIFNPLSSTKLYLPPLSTLPSVTSFSFSNVGREYSLLNPISNEIYSLDLRQMRDLFITKVILSHPPNYNNNNNNSPFIAIAIVGNTSLVFCEYDRDRVWKSVPVEGFSAEDVIYSESDGLIYSVNKSGDVLVFSFSNGVVDASVMNVIPTVSRIEGDLHYLVMLKGELLLVTRSLGAEPDIISYCEVYETVRFDVYRFSCEVGEEGSCKWERVLDLGDGVVFVGENSSLGLLASEFPGCEGNRIYFTDDHSKCSDVGFFDLRHGRIEALPCYPQDVSLPFQWATPVWITPNPC